MKSANGHSLKCTFTLYIFIRHTVEKTNIFFKKEQRTKISRRPTLDERESAFLKSSDVTN